MPQTTLSGWEKGTVDEPVRKLLLIARALDTTVEELFNLHDEVPSKNN